MNKPVIMCVDDDPDVLNAVERDLRQHFRSDFRIVKAASGADGLDATRKLMERGTSVAMFVVDYRMPQMSGTDFLLEGKKLYPDACRVLLTAYADTEAAITSINEVGLDHYLLKPWDPPEEHLYPVLDDLASVWQTRYRPPFDGIRVAGAPWSAACYAVKEWLSRNNVPYQWINIEDDPAIAELCLSLSGDPRALPVVLFPDDAHLVTPSTRELAERIGLQTRATLPFYDVVIVGGGPTGLGAAVYASSEGLRTLLIEESATGGQAGTSSRIENYLGFPSGLSGGDLAHRATPQAKRFGTEILSAQQVVAVRREDPYRIVTLADGSEIASYCLLIATGVSVRRLELPDIDNFTGTSIFYGAAMTEAASFRDRDVSVVGGANSAGQGALFFARHARTVRMIVRAASLDISMSRYLVDRIAATPNIDVVTRATVDAVHGESVLERIDIRSLDTDEVTTVNVAAMFIFIGAASQTGFVADMLELDDFGYVLTGPDLPKGPTGEPRGWALDRDPFLYETNVPGIFAAGDVRAGSGKRVAAAVGEGAATVSMIHKYLESV